ncbi:HAD-IIA family hydrolase [Paenibacillus endoradicis]|uniref:HAD-IIA family hydrolase n=1 Tax=Paenibacillus endoradicis TaxID=2972487 RepID=UPI002158F360|nr:HAD-IIA family hydrolase [Paenibacillus endoradicis]MCR8658824.1 HAD-IIA family hydrolase [Paenibacillus endoradicis]
MASEHVNGFIIDLDGTVYTGQQDIPGAINGLRKLQQHNIPFLFLSNRGNYSRAMCQEKLAIMGIQVDAEQIVLSSTVTARYLREHYPQDAIWTLGDAGLAEELRSHKLVIAEKPEQAKWLVITLHESLTYEDLNMAFRAVRGGAQIIATNEDRMFPTEAGDCIDVAGMIGAIVYATGVEVTKVMGKPSTIMADTALSILGLPASECMVVGDSIASDVMLGKLHGIATALVLTGSTTAEDIEQSEIKPDIVVGSLAALIDQHISI